MMADGIESVLQVYSMYVPLVVRIGRQTRTGGTQIFVLPVGNINFDFLNP